MDHLEANKAHHHCVAAQDQLKCISGSNRAETLVRRVIAAQRCWFRSDVADGAPDEALQTALNLAYSEAMAKVYKDFPDDVDVACLYAQSLMQLRPWKLWELSQSDGKVQVWDRETTALNLIIRKALHTSPHHPGLCHFHVHFLEMSPYARECLGTCKALANVWPDCGHLLHMASHIYMLTGDYDLAVKVNQDGIDADMRWAKVRGHNNFYHGYLCHNLHMLELSI